MTRDRAKYVWDYDLTQQQFDDLLAGRYEDGALDRDWAAVRLIEWAPYKEMIPRIGYSNLIENWPRWRTRLRSAEQRRSLDFLVEWLVQNHQELLTPIANHVH